MTQREENASLLIYDKLADVLASVTRESQDRKQQFQELQQQLLQQSQQQQQQYQQTQQQLERIAKWSSSSSLSSSKSSEIAILPTTTSVLSSSSSAFSDDAASGATCLNDDDLTSSSVSVISKSTPVGLDVTGSTSDGKKRQRAPHSDMHRQHQRHRSARKLTRITSRQRQDWVRVLPLPHNVELELPPLLVDVHSSADVPSDPDPAALSKLDHFTQYCWAKYYKASSDKKTNMAYSVRSLMPDSMYVYLVREMYSSGYVNRSDLSTQNTRMFTAINMMLTRNARFIVFDTNVIAGQSRASQSVPLLYRVEPQKWQLTQPSTTDCLRCIPISQLRSLLEIIHSHVLHRKTTVYPDLRDVYAGVPREVIDEYNKKYCPYCNTHQRHKTRNTQLTPIISTHIRDRYVIDCIDMRSDPDEVQHDGTYKWILHMIDHHSRYRWARAMKSKHASPVQQIVKEWWSEHGRPDILHSDNGGEFKADLIFGLCWQWGVKKRHGRPHKPQTQGIIERANQEVHRYLAAWRSHPQNTGKGWVSALPEITRAANYAYTRSIKGYPYKVFLPPDRPRTQPGHLREDLDDETDEEDGSDDEVESKDEMEELEDWGDRKSHKSSEVAVSDCNVIDCNVTAAEARPLLPSLRTEGAQSQSPILAGESLPEQDDDLELNRWVAEGIEGDLFMWMDQSDSPSPETLSTADMSILSPGMLDGLRYPQWNTLCDQLLLRLRRVGTQAYGDCGPIAAVSAHHQHLLFNIKIKGSEHHIARQQAIRWIESHAELYSTLDEKECFLPMN